MDPEFATYLQLIGRRLQLIWALTAELQDGVAAMTALDLRSMEKRTLEQESICAELVSVVGEVDSIKTQLHEGLLNRVEYEQLVLFEQATAVAAQELMHAGHVHSALVRRSRRSIHVLMNVLSSCTTECLRPSAAYPVASYF